MKKIDPETPVEPRTSEEPRLRPMLSNIVCGQGDKRLSPMVLDASSLLDDILSIE
jgi:hypothetical protein